MRKLTAVLALAFLLGSFLPVAQAATHQLTKDEEQLFKLIKRNGLQKRKGMKLDPILCKVARARAQDMGKRRYFAHVNPSGQGPNFLVTKAEYGLPSFYDSSREANNIESIAARSPTGVPRDALEQWLNSPPHRTHTMGLVAFNKAQNRIGVGIANFNNAPFATYYVFLSAPDNENPKPPKVKLKNAKGRVIATTR